MKQPVEYRNPVEIQIDYLDKILSQSYLCELSECEILKPKQDLSSVRWYRITKIVMEKDVFFGDKLSMLYMALHEYSKNVILVLNKDNGGNIELYLGARDFDGDKYYSGEILKSGLQGYLPGVSFKHIHQLKSIQYKTPYIASLSALASLRDDKKETFVQGLERLINATSSIPSFRAYFIAENVSENQAQSMINAFGQIYTSLSSLAEIQVTMSESYTTGVSESISDGITNSISTNISKTVTHSEGKNTSVSESVGRSTSRTTNYSPDLLETIGSAIFGGESGSSVQSSENYNTGKQSGESVQDSVADQKGETTGRQQSKTRQTGSNSSDTKGRTSQLTFKDRVLQQKLKCIDNQMERLSNGIPFGLWSVATYFIAPQQTTALKLANLYRGCIIGEDSNLGSCAINVWSDQKKVTNLLQCLKSSVHPRFIYRDMDVSAGVLVTSKELAIHLSLPSVISSRSSRQGRAKFWNKCNFKS